MLLSCINNLIHSYILTKLPENFLLRFFATALALWFLYQKALTDSLHLKSSKIQTS